MFDTSTIQTPEQIVSARRVILGPDDSYRGLHPLKYPWTSAWLDTAVKNHWLWNEPNLLKDIGQYRELADESREVHDDSLAFLSNLDAIQLGNLSLNILPKITAPEIRTCLNRQVWEEEIHVRSYSTCVEAVCTDKVAIYNRYQHVKELAEKNKLIVSQANALNNIDFNPGTFNVACVANMGLEGIHFFSGFLGMYAMIRQERRMFGEREMIAYIQRDEDHHIDLFGHTLTDAQTENPDYSFALNPSTRDDALEVIESIVKCEKNWSSFIFKEGRCGITPAISDEFLEWRGNIICAKAGLPLIYGKHLTRCPIPWFEQYSSVSKEGNFFETRPSSYQAGSALKW